MPRKLPALIAALALILTFSGQSMAVAASHTTVSVKHGALNHRLTPAERKAAAARVKKAGIKLKNATPPPAPIASSSTASPSPAAPSVAAPAVAGPTMAVPNSMPDYFGTTPNYANSPLPPVTSFSGGGGTGAAAVATVIGGLVVAVTVTTPGTGYTTPPLVQFASFDGTGAAATASVAGGAVSAITVTNPGTGYGGIRKFVDSLPGLDTTGTGTTGQNDLGQAIPVAVPDTTTYPFVAATATTPAKPAADYYVIELGQYSEQLSRDLPVTTLRGYHQVNVPAGKPNLGRYSYLGPLIVAQKDRPVRVKFINSLPTGAGGNLFLPVDTTVPGSGQGPTGADYSQNRASMHLHGGNTPWISDGTEHQWITPAGEATEYPRGVSTRNVPDMPDPGPGAMTFYYTNQQSARLMFYHDHSLATTRLNVYAGEAAGYVLQDKTEQGLKDNGTLPPASAELPLIIQDKTFVPGPNQLAAEDPTWAYAGKGGLWLPHTYMTNQDPADISGANAMGRWDYGPWFWPPFTAIDNKVVANPLAGTTPFEGPVNPGTPNPSIVPESFMDTPLVNGTAYPSLSVDHQAYRFRILNASDDRTLNLQLYYAKSNAPMWLKDPVTGAQILNDGNAGEVPMVVAAPNPLFPTWPTDGRDGGVPDPTKAGPPLVQIGTEGGFLPKVATLPNQPVDYTYNRRDITVLNVSSKTLFLGPAERADVIVDFSKVPAGSQLILYNDAPAPVPAFDPRYDYFTGDPDNTPTGGAPTTLLGYGPNTRTIMQFQVQGTPAATAFDVAKLTAALPLAYGETQDAPIVPETAYNAAYPFKSDINAKPATVDTYSRIQDHSLNFFNGGPLTGLNVVAGGTGYATAPTVTITGGGATTIATGTATVDALGVVTALTLVDGGAGYTGPPTVTLTGGGGTGALASALGVNTPYQPKSIVEDFDTQYGRMNAMLGMEIPRTTAITNTAIPFYQADPPTEIIGATANPLATPVGTLGDGTQIWKITHNGVDTHAIHFHLFNVQVINRVGWDGAVRPTDANELGWKETVRMSPLEDIIIALRPIVPIVPFDLPNSIRPLDPTQAVGSQVPNTFHNIDPVNEPATVTNELVNFGFEYVWHCHLLGHEENDMMRPIIIGVAPKPATGLTATAGAPTKTVLTWNDNSINETAFTVQRAPAAGGLWTDIAVVPGTADPSGKGPVSYTSTGTPGTAYNYQVIANNLVGYTQTYTAPVVGYPHPSFDSAPIAVLNVTSP